MLGHCSMCTSIHIPLDIRGNVGNRTNRQEFGKHCKVKTPHHKTKCSKPEEEGVWSNIHEALRWCGISTHDGEWVAQWGVQPSSSLQTPTQVNTRIPCSSWWYIHFCDANTVAEGSVWTVFWHCFMHWLYLWHWPIHIQAGDLHCAQWLWERYLYTSM